MGVVFRARSDRRKVLRHHPDKKASAGGEANDDSFFKCIAKGTPHLTYLNSLLPAC
jgi:DnaJ family protein C protein 2